MNTRFVVVDGSQSCHCCFEATVVDTSAPTMIGGKPYAPDGVQRYESICECFSRADAERVCAALNLHAQRTDP